MGELPPWTKIEKGDRRPTERVLVAYEYKDALHDQKGWGVTGAWWNPKRQTWVADHGKPIGGVTHWMPLPETRRPRSGRVGRMARYGNTRISRIRKRIEVLRRAIRDHDPEAAELAWDDLEPFIPAIMQPQEEGE